MKLIDKNITYVENFIKNEIAEAVKSGNAERIRKANKHETDWNDWKSKAMQAEIELPVVDVIPNKNGEKSLDETVRRALRKHLKTSDLTKFSANTFAEICAVFYGATNSSLNGFETSLRAFADGWDFMWAPAPNRSGRTTQTAQIALQSAQIAEQKTEIESQKAYIARLERQLAEMKNGKKNK